MIAIDRKNDPLSLENRRKRRLAADSALDKEESEHRSGRGIITAIFIVLIGSIAALWIWGSSNSGGSGVASARDIRTERAAEAFPE